MSFLYTLFKDIFSKAKSNREALLTVEQIDISLAELERKRGVDVEQIAKSDAKEQGAIKVDFAHRGMERSQMLQRKLDESRRNYQKQSQNVTAEFESAKKIMLLEKKKLVKKSQAKSK